MEKLGFKYESVEHGETFQIDYANCKVVPKNPSYFWSNGWEFLEYVVMHN